MSFLNVHQVKYISLVLVQNSGLCSNLLLQLTAQKALLLVPIFALKKISKRHNTPQTWLRGQHGDWNQLGDAEGTASS